VRCREYSDEQSARAGVRDGEVVMYVRRSDGSLQWGVIPAQIEIDQGEGRDPVRQPAGEFLAHWWSEIEALRERE
jgi:hypothetical protein